MLSPTSLLLLRNRGSQKRDIPFSRVCQEKKAKNTLFPRLSSARRRESCTQLSPPSSLSLCRLSWTQSITEPEPDPAKWSDQGCQRLEELPQTRPADTNASASSTGCCSSPCSHHEATSCHLLPSHPLRLAPEKCRLGGGEGAKGHPAANSQHQIRSISGDLGDIR